MKGSAIVVMLAVAGLVTVFAATGWCQDAQLLQGDSRNLTEILWTAHARVSSPAYGNISVEKNASRSIDIEKQYEIYKASGGGQSLEAFRNTQERHSQG